MKHTPDVNREASTPRRPVSARYPVDRIKLLEAIQARRGDPSLSDTVSHALDQLIESYFPGLTQRPDPEARQAP